jgi:tRNA(fMet)-specific endonuclease VapC
LGCQRRIIPERKRDKLNYPLPFQRRHPHVTVRILGATALELATTVIIVEEQVRGRLDRVRRARSDTEVVRAYRSLLATFLYFRTITIMDFDEPAQTIFQRLRAQRIRIGTLDLRIAAIALSREATLVTRNRQDFAGIPALNIADWSVPGDDVSGH